MIRSQSFTESLQSVPAARHFAATSLDGLPAELIDAVILMVSELATNALRHAASAFAIDIDRDSDRVIVTVFDNGDGAAERKRHGSLDPSGRGLQIVGSLADEWGERRPERNWKKSVWFRVRLTSAAEPLTGR